MALSPQGHHQLTVYAAGEAACHTRPMNVLQIAQHADDLGRARAFYERLLNAPPVGFFDPPGLLFFQSGPVRLLLEQGAASALIYFKVDDVRAAIQALRAEGAEIVAEPELIFRHLDDKLGPAGNFCCCAGYDTIVRAVQDATGVTKGA